MGLPPRMAFPRVPEADVGSPMDMDRASVASGDERRREMSVVSMEDPDVRLAAEALSGLGNPGTSWFCARVVFDGRARVLPARSSGPQEVHSKAPQTALCSRGHGPPRPAAAHALDRAAC
jgi:hypothetical protein